MSIVGIGFDLVEVSRFESPSESLLSRLFKLSELGYSNSFSLPSVHLAGYFAIKEAFLKALGTGLSEGLSWQDIEVDHKESGQPFIIFRGKEIPAMVSVSHTDTTAGAVVILLKQITI